MIQNYVKIATVSFIILTISTHAAYHETHDSRLPSLMEFVYQLDYKFEKSRAGRRANGTKAMESNDTQLSERIKKELSNLEALECCKHCIVSYFSRNAKGHHRSEQCVTSPICKVTKKIDEILLELQAHLGLEYWYIQYTTWELGKTIVENPQFLSNKLLADDFTGIMTQLETIEADAKKGTYDQTIDRFLALALAHHYWFRANTNSIHKTPFKFSYKKPQPIF